MLFRSNTSVCGNQSAVKEFVRITLRRQVQIAQFVAIALSLEVTLFDRSFISDHTILVDNIRVEVDINGSHAILSTGTQSSFLFPDYCRYLPSGFHYKKSNNIFTIL